MIRLCLNIAYSGRSDITIFDEDHWPDSEEGVMVQILLNDKLREREAINELTKIITKSDINWIKPGSKLYSLDLDLAKSEIDSLQKYEWLKGIAKVHPEIEYEETETFGEPSTETLILLCIYKEDFPLLQQPKDTPERRKPIAIKITGGKNIIIRDNVGVGNMNFLDAENVDNLNADRNILITPSTEPKPEQSNPWYKKYLALLYVSIIAPLIVAAIVILYIQPWAESHKETVQNNKQSAQPNTEEGISLLVSPSNYSINPGSKSKFLVKLTNSLEHPVFNIAIRIRIETGDLTHESIDMLPIDRSKITSDLGGLKIHHDLFGFSYIDKEGKSVAQYAVYDIDAKETKTYEIKIDGSQTTQEAEMAFHVVDFSDRPKEIVRKKPHFGFLDKGNALANEKKYAEAIAYYKKAVALGGKSSKVSLNWGNVLFELGQLDDAISKYEESIEINPKYALAYYNLGVLYYQKGEHIEAVALFSKAIDLAPQSTLAKMAQKTIDFIK